MNLPPIVEGADAFTLDGGPTGVLMLHGFTANPFGLRAFAESLHESGHTVHVPRLPGHGTTWEDLARSTWADWDGEAQRALTELRGRCDRVAVVGLSFGGAVALHLAATRPDDARSVVVVNPHVVDRRLVWAPLVKLVRRTVAGIADDISLGEGTERAYDRIPVSALVQVVRFQRMVRGELPRIRQPILAFRSGADKVIPNSTSYVLGRVASKDRELVMLPRSFHVAWLDQDADLLFEGTRSFLARTLGAAV
jgi:carboxylesterase